MARVRPDPASRDFPRGSDMSVRARLSERYVERRLGWRLLWVGAKSLHYYSELKHRKFHGRNLRKTVSRVRRAGNGATISFSAPSEPTVSIVIPVFNNWKLTRQCLASLSGARPTCPYEVIVVDDHSTDATLELLRTIPGIRVVANDENLGFTRAANRGAASAHGQFVFFLNNDTLVMPGCIEGLLQTLRDPTVAAVGAKLVTLGGLLLEAGSLIWADATCHNIGRNHDPAAPEYNFCREVDYCSAAALMVRTDVLSRAGYFDERFAPAYYEDTDLCMAIRRAGCRVMADPTATVVHLEGMTHGTEDRKAIPGTLTTKANERANRSVFAEKWKQELRAHRAPPKDVLRGELTGSSVRSRPNLLICDWVIPASDRDSTSHRMEAMLKLLVPLANRVTFMPMLRGANHRYANRLSQLGVEVMFPAPRSFPRFLQSRTDFYDLVILSRLAVAEKWLPDVRRYQTRAAVVFDTVDIHSLRFKREREIRGRRAAGDAEHALQAEQSLVAACDLTSTVTSAEEHLIRELDPSARTIVLPNIHATRAGEPPGFDDRRGLLFIGMFLHSPNLDAVSWFSSAILPLIRRSLPIQLVVIGADPPPTLIRESGRDVIFTGWVADVTPLFDAARVFVAPLRFGAGMKGKIGQSLSLGLPVVTTSIGAEGMDLRDETDVLIRDDPESFADAVVRLHDDETLWTELSGRGRETVRDRWSPEVMRRRLETLLRETLPIEGKGA